MSLHTDEMIGRVATLLTCPRGRGRLTIKACKGDFQVWSADIMASGMTADAPPDALHLYEGSTIALPSAPAFAVRGSLEANHLRYRWNEGN